MEKNNYTPGPWEVKKDHYGFQVIKRNTEFVSIHICTIHQGINPVEANARLIAAAPVQHEALKIAHKQLKEYYDWGTFTEKELDQLTADITTISAAIKLAESEEGEGR